MIIQFNWCEINKISSNPDNKLILIFCLYANKAFPLERRLASSLHTLGKKLNTSSFPSTLLNNNYIFLDKARKGVYSNYECREPQVYLTNFHFLTRKIPAYQKTEYLSMIAQRNMNNRNNWIPKEYVSKEFLDNPLIRTTATKIYFPLENPPQ